MTTKVLVIDVTMANIIPPLVNSSPPPMDSDDEDDDDFGDFANANDFSSYDCDVLASSLPSSPPHVHKVLDYPGDPSRDPFRDDCPPERNDPKDNTSQDSVISIVTSDSGLSSEINLSSGDDVVVESNAVTVHTDIDGEKLNGDLSADNEQIVDKIFVSDLKKDFEKNEHEPVVNIDSNSVNGEIFDLNDTSVDEKTVFKNSNEAVATTQNEKESVVNNSDSSLVIQGSTICERVDSKSQRLEFPCSDKILNPLEVFREDSVYETFEKYSEDVEVLKDEEMKDLDEFTTFQVAENSQSIEILSGQNSNQINDTSKQNLEDSNFNDFNSFADFQKCLNVDNEESETKNVQFDEFAEFSANFESVENNAVIAPSDEMLFDETAGLDTDDFDDFAGFETAPSVIKVSDNFADFNTGPNVSDLDPIEILKNDRSKFSETVIKTISKSFGLDESTNVCDIPTRDLLKTGALWQYIEDVENTRAFQYQWDESRSCEALLAALNIDTRNILQRGGKLGGGVPRFAAYLGSDPLEPSPVVPPTSAPIPAPTEVPAAQFDWNDAGLVNPLDRTTKTGTLEQLTSGETPVPDISARPNISDDDSVNSLKLGDYDPEPPVQSQSEIQISDSDDDFTDFRSCPEPISTVKLRETHISSKDTSPAWLQPTILTPELSRKSGIVSEPESIQDAIDPVKNVIASKDVLKEKAGSIEDDDFADFQSVPLENVPNSIQTVQNTSTKVSNTYESSLNVEKPLVPIPTSSLPLKPEILRPIIKEPVIEINWPAPGIINDEPINIVEMPCISNINNDIEPTNMNITNSNVELMNTSILNHITGPVVLEKSAVNESIRSVDLTKIIKNQTETKSNSIEPLKFQKDKSKPANSNNAFKSMNEIKRTVDDEDWSDFVSVRSDIKLVSPVTKNDNLQNKELLNTLDVNSLGHSARYTKSDMIVPIKNNKEVYLKETSNKKSVLKPDVLMMQSTAQHLYQERNSLQNDTQFRQDDIQRKIASNTFNVPMSNYGFKTDKLNDRRQNYDQHESTTLKKHFNPFITSNRMTTGLKPDKVDSKRPSHIQHIQQTSSEDDWSDFVSSGQPTIQRFNTRHSPPKFASWNAPAVPNIITNPAHFEIYRAPSDDIPKSHGIRPGSNSISTISTLPDLDFMTPSGMIWPRSSSSSKK